MSILKASGDVRLFTEEENSEFGSGFFHNNKKYVHHSPLHHSDTAYVNVSDHDLLILCGFTIQPLSHCP